MIANVLGGIIAGLIAIAIYIAFTRSEADRAPLFRSSSPRKEPRAVKPPDSGSQKDCSHHQKFHRPAQPISPVAQETRTA